MVDADHPLFVYLPCGVGGGPGGVAFGLKLLRRPRSLPVRRTDPFAMHAARRLYRLHDQIAVQDLGIDNLTAADGLAVGRASGSVGRAMERLLDGFYTLTTRRCMTCWAGWRQRKISVLNPPRWPGWPDRSVCASKAYHQLQGLSEQQLQQATHLVWATGGGMVPEEEMAQYLAKGANL